MTSTIVEGDLLWERPTRWIVDEHDGRIGVSSTPGGGATFRAHLPSSVAVQPDFSHQARVARRCTPYGQGVLNFTSNTSNPTVEQLMFEMKRLIVGQDQLIERLLVALLAAGHVPASSRANRTAAPARQRARGTVTRPSGRHRFGRGTCGCCACCSTTLSAYRRLEFLDR